MLEFDVDAGARVLLISNSTLHGSGYLDHAAAEIRLRGLPRGRAPRALRCRTRSRLRGVRGESASARSGRWDSASIPSTTPRSPAEAVAAAEAIFIGGGNTFRLLDALHERGLLAAIRQRVAEGMPYIGSSAGSIVACPTLKTTKDMPIVEPPSFEALGLVDFQISPHYLDPDPASTHMGETQEERILQYLEENDRPVAGLREGAILRVDEARCASRACSGARLFRRGREPVEAMPVGDMKAFLEPRDIDARDVCC